jgi:hypothetical protein
VLRIEKRPIKIAWDSQVSIPFERWLLILHKRVVGSMKIVSSHANGLRLGFPPTIMQESNRSHNRSAW